MFLTHSHYVQIENGALLRDAVRSLKMILGGHEKVRTFLGKKCGNHKYIRYKINQSTTNHSNAQMDKRA